MDEPGLEVPLHMQALDGLATLNWLGRSAALLWPRLIGLQRRLERPLRLLDLACGGGDVTLALARRARRHGMAWEFLGADKSDVALSLARRRAQQAAIEITFQPLDVLRDPLPEGYDVVLCSLFLHHLSDEEAVDLLRRMGQAAQHLVLVSDLRRSRANYWMTAIGCRLLTRSPVVHYDGPLSIRCAFTDAEARELAAQAGLTPARVTRHFPVRWLLEWVRP